MEKDYSEYQHTRYDVYRAHRSNLKDVVLDYFINKAVFSAEEKNIWIHVDSYNELDNMQDFINEAEEKRAAHEGRISGSIKPKEDLEDDMEVQEEQKELLEDDQKVVDRMRKKFDIDFTGRYWSDVPGEEYCLKYPMINIFSGSRIQLNYGEGILDFIYADFITPLNESLKINVLMEKLGEHIREKDKESGEEKQFIIHREPEKIYSRAQEIVQEFYEYETTFSMIKDVAYASLYSAICPPVFKGAYKGSNKKLQWYGNYLLELQKEYRELIEFCYDEDFHPEVLGKLYPSERLAIYRRAHGFPFIYTRSEELSISRTIMGGKEMPFGMSRDELLPILKKIDLKPNEEQKAFAEEIGIPINTLMIHLQHPFFMSVDYEFRSISDLLELEFTKMLEQNVRFRKCKRCGKYFIMKGNYDTNYCDRIAEGETRTCQELAAIENYKAKIADNKAIPIYNKYYKRYAARVKVRQIKEDEFKKWKYQAMSKRDECSDGKITPEEFIEWMELAFPNRKPKK